MTELVDPMQVVWTTSSHNAIDAKGGRYLGVVPLLLALYAVTDKRMRWWWISGAVCVVLAMGSMQNELALPFLFYNGLMKAVVRPLTQPTRLLVMSLVAFGVCVSWTLVQISRRERGGLIGWGLVLLMFVEGVIVGGLGLKPPTIELPVVIVKSLGTVGYSFGLWIEKIERLVCLGCCSCLIDIRHRKWELHLEAA